MLAPTGYKRTSDPNDRKIAPSRDEAQGRFQFSTILISHQIDVPNGDALVDVSKKTVLPTVSLSACRGHPRVCTMAVTFCAAYVAGRVRGPVPPQCYQERNIRGMPYYMKKRNFHTNRIQVQKIFVVNLPSRPDKRDAIVLGSSIIGFHIDWIDGVTPDQLNPKSYPYVSFILLTSVVLASDNVSELESRTQTE